jgi:hypothetical protein
MPRRQLLYQLLTSKRDLFNQLTVVALLPTN